MMEDIFEMILESDLTPDLKLLNDVCGIETVKNLLRELSGINLYIPKLSHLNSVVRKYMKKHPEKSYKQIAKEIGVSETFLKNLLKRPAGTVK
jgi:hypothetical protein